jgi:hypothetical protein
MCAMKSIKIIFFLFLMVNCFAEEIIRPKLVGIPDATNPFVIISFPWRDVNRSDYTKLAESDANDPEVIWSKAQKAIDAKDLPSLLNCYSADSQNSIRAQYEKKFNQGITDREGIKINILSVAYVDSLAILAFNIGSSQQKSFTWVDQLQFNNGWKMLSGRPINNPIVMAASAVSYAENEKLNISQVPKENYDWFRMTEDYKVITHQLLPPDKRTADQKYLELGILKSAIIKNKLNLDSYVGDDVELIHIRKVAMAMRSGDEAIIRDNFETRKLELSKKAFNWHLSDASKRQTLIYADYKAAEDRYLILGDDEGAKAVCILRCDVQPPKIIHELPKSGTRNLSPLLISTSVIQKMLNVK